MPLGDALNALASGLGASAAAISRHHHRSEERPRLVALVTGNLPVPLPRAYCSDVLGNHFGYARAGSVWVLSDMRNDPGWTLSHELQSWLSVDTVRDIVAIPISVTHQHVDYLEFHFMDVLTGAEQKDIEALVPTIERSWNGRKPGLVAQATTDSRAVLVHRSTESDRLQWTVPILGMSNPAGLSRAEFRVCVLLSRGLSVKAVSSELGLSDNTVRSHLRAIYAKTETTSLPELIYLIMSVTEDDTSQTVVAHRA